jgi:Spy/CpxP family protein refolding chaperone
MRHKILFLMFLSAMMLWAQAQPLPRPGAGGQAQGIAALKKALDLTDQQIQQLTQLRREEAQILQPLRTQIQEKNQALKEALASPNPDPSVVGNLTLELRNLRRQVQETNKMYHEKALAILTPEQRTKVENMGVASRRMAQMGPALRAATALNLILPPAATAPAAGQGPAAAGAPVRRLGPQR